MSFSSGFVTIVNYIVDDALYPVLFMSYLYNLFEQFDFINNPIYYYTIQSGIIFIILGINMIGIFYNLFSNYSFHQLITQIRC